MEQPVKDSHQKNGIVDITKLPSCWSSAKVSSRPDVNRGGHSAYAVEAIKKDELISIIGGCVVYGDAIYSVPQPARRRAAQIEEDLYMVPIVTNDADFLNHSCDPNAGLCGNTTVVALRDIGPGEIICFDYATDNGSPFDEFDCQCGAVQCRGRVTGDDWKIPILWEKYAGHFSPYLQRRIDRLKQSFVNGSQ